MIETSKNLDQLNDSSASLVYQKISGLSRAAKIILSEAQVEYTEQIDDLIQLPVFVKADSDGLSGVLAIGEAFMAGGSRARASFEHAIILLFPAVKEILENRVLCFVNKTNSDSKKLADARYKLVDCMKSLEFLSSPHEYLGEQFSYADATWAGLLSYMDYLDEINWDNFPKSRQWYSLVKSRPSLAGILQETLPGIQASKQYAKIDF